MGLIGVIWGLGGFLLLLASAMYRLTPLAVSAFREPLGAVHYAALAVWVAFMVYSEAYRGFHRAFAPRFGARLRHLYQHPELGLVVLAPFYGMGLLHATRKRKLVAWSVTLGIIVLIVLVRHLVQPWRGIVDVGVVLGLMLGSLSVIYFTIRAFSDRSFSFATDVPDRGRTNS